MSTFHSSFSFMGVLNVTPNSFSDGGELLKSEVLQQRVQAWQEVKASYYDLGAESTAPMNTAIDPELEWQRLFHALKFLPEHLPYSLDTYRAQTVRNFLSQKTLALWNDVSGQLDDELADLLQDYPHLQTVYCHNNVDSREHTGSHMHFTSEENIWNQVEKSFERALEWYEQRNFKRPILDPCFGFAKSFEQNWELLRQLPRFISNFELHHGKQQWLIGISRKSFLKRLCSEKVDHDVRRQTEYMQTFYLAWLWRELGAQRDIVVRLHDPALAFALSRMGEQL